MLSYRKKYRSKYKNDLFVKPITAFRIPSINLLNVEIKTQAHKNHSRSTFMCACTYTCHGQKLCYGRQVGTELTLDWERGLGSGLG